MRGKHGEKIITEAELLNRLPLIHECMHIGGRHGRLPHLAPEHLRTMVHVLIRLLHDIEENMMDMPPTKQQIHYLVMASQMVGSARKVYLERDFKKKGGESGIY